MYADASDGKSNSVARVMTPVLEGSTAVPSSLLTFWFSMWSLNPLEMGTLNVYVRYNGVMNPIPVWSTSGVQNSITEWLEAKVLVTSVAEYQVSQWLNYNVSQIEGILSSYLFNAFMLGRRLYVSCFLQ